MSTLEYIVEIWDGLMAVRGQRNEEEREKMREGALAYAKIALGVPVSIKDNN